MKLQRGDGITLTRDVTATIIPQGSQALLFKGTLVLIVQALGNSYTVEFNGQWLLIHEEDADALGVTINDFQVIDGNQIEQVYSLLSTCFDPEIPVNIVDLGLIYEVKLQEQADKHLVNITMTLTAPGCGMGPVLIDDIKRKVKKLSWVCDINIELVFDPPWTTERMSDEAKLTLGMI